jgi:hypothetical protein
MHAMGMQVQYDKQISPCIVLGDRRGDGAAPLHSS